MIRHSLFAIRYSLFAIRYSLFAILLLTACSPPGAGVAPTFAPPPTAGPPPGSIYTVTYGSIAETVELRGRMAAEQEASLMFPVGGTLKAVHVSPGDQVSAGDPLAELDAPDAERAAVEARFNLELAEAQLAIAKLQLEPAAAPQPAANADLLAAQIASAQAEQELQQAQVEYQNALQRPWDPPEATEAYIWTLQLNEWNYELAQARLAQIQQAQQQTRAIQELQVEMAQIRVERANWLQVMASEQLSNTLLTVPFSGIVVSIDKRAGDQVGAYETIGVVADPSELWIVATVLEEDVNRVTVGQAATIRLDAYPDQVYSGTVLQVANQTATWQGQDAYKVTIAFDRGQDVPPIMRMGADVTITGRVKENVLLIPTQAILTIGGQEYVELAGEGSEVKRVEIHTGITNDTETEVVDGLQAGQEIRIP
ncbi:MAG: hypothetical protein DRI77_12545 [Chloroflexi bacterium]|nr:MAG: hypothetical protein DRI77_12545 [Chloroflexota bacterium]